MFRRTASMLRGIPVAGIAVEEHAVHDDIAPLMFLQLVEGAEEGGLAGPGGTDDHHGLALADSRCDAP